MPCAILTSHSLNVLVLYLGTAKSRNYLLIFGGFSTAVRLFLFFATVLEFIRKKPMGCTYVLYQTTKIKRNNFLETPGSSDIY